MDNVAIGIQSRVIPLGIAGTGKFTERLRNRKRVLDKLFDVGVVVGGDTDFEGSSEGVDVFHEG